LKIFHFTFLIAFSLILIFPTSLVFSEEPEIPDWIKNIAIWWGEGQVSNQEFINAIQWLIDNGILVVSSSEAIDQTPQDEPAEIEETSEEQEIPSIFVSINGNDSNLGTKENPVKTINGGIIKASENQIDQVLVSEGTYGETVTILDGISIKGGYSHNNNWSESDSFVTTITGVSSGGQVIGIFGVEIISPTTISGFTIQTIDASSEISNYGVYCNNCSGLTLSNNVIIAGNGGDGVNGQDGVNGDTGGSGGPGHDGASFVASCNDSSKGSGGSKGTSSSGNNGGAGGNGGTMDTECAEFPLNSNYGATNGFKGQNANNSIPNSFGTAGAGGSATSGLAGGNGQPGKQGDAGSNGQGGVSDGLIEVNFWIGVKGSSGQDGSDGTGGGGGGGSGGSDEGVDCSGSGGGGGGAGGTAGTGGHGGTSGGASFGVFFVNSNDIKIIENQISSSNGGNGGTGGKGGTDGDGGLGGIGGNAVNDCGAGGNGGIGGSGGQGGAGGGGAGGISFAIYLVNSTIDENNNDLNAGSPGNGGLSEGNNGSDGESGVLN